MCLKHGKVGGGIIGPQPTFVVTENHIEDLGSGLID
jgi:hypothetical protein